ncbi:hypothetical protein ACHAWU_005955 [Discostella pseudostelligera]|uniref:Sugar fermentation stimulation protein C-terminal domain-containing protein n=1 Tax=Discostella pseudostelligera TaxID=259834 RepID=A0ABD3M8L1_9STRA
MRWSILAFALSPPTLTYMTRTKRNSSRRLPSQPVNEDGDDAPSLPSPSTKRRKKKLTSSSSYDSMPPLLDLGKLVRGTLVKRPSAVIRSPYVADVSLLDDSGKSTTKMKAESSSKTATTLLAHAPALDVGGMCVVGSEIYLSERGGDGKTSHSIELVRGAPLRGIGIGMLTTTSSNDDSTGRGVLVGAHPRLGELIAEEVLKLGLLREALPLKSGFELGPVNDINSSKKKESPKKKASPKKGERTGDQSLQNSITTTTNANIDNKTSPATKINLSQQVTLGDSRVDFQISLTQTRNSVDSSHRVVFEVKNVVCADFESGTEPTPSGPGDCIIVAPPSTSSSNNKKEGYQRSALFPWGRTRGQKFDGRPVVSERACKHLRNLQSLLDENVTPVVLFIVNRSDCQSVRACREKCPVFAEILEDVVRSGVKALAVRVRWTEEGQCFFDGIIPVHV